MQMLTLVALKKEDLNPYDTQGRSQEFLFVGAKCDANTFIKTTSTHIYIHIRALFYYIYTYARFFIIYTHFLFDKLYIYTKKKGV